MYVLTEKMAPLGISNCVIAMIAIIGGTVLHVAAMKSNNTYRSKLRANEQVITRLEKALGDYQQQYEIEAPKSFLFGAGDARVMIFYSLWISEFAIAYLFAFAK